MANISITSACNRDCGFCFAGEAGRRASPDAAHMPLARFEAALDFLVRSGVPEARLLGGEPTLHPDFGRVIHLALSRGLGLVVFSGGLIPESALRALEATPAASVAVLLNVVPPPPGQTLHPVRQDDVCRRLGPRVTLGVTIDSPGIRLGPLLDVIERRDLRRTVRLGLGHPALAGANSYLRPRHYPEVGRRVAEFAAAARERGVGVEFDCGWVPCMFPDGTVAALGPGGGSLGNRCGPILDLLPDGRLISCYPLAALGAVPLEPDLDAPRARAIFAARQQADRAFRLTPDCDACSRRAGGECSGGCLAAALQRQRRRTFSIAAQGSA